MRKEIIKKEIKEVTTTIEEIFCDLCNKKALHGEWNKNYWEINDTDIRISIRHTQGTSYPENRWGTYIDIDICPECFQNKLIPWLESQGAIIKEKKFDF